MYLVEQEQRLRQDVEHLVGAIGERDVYRYPSLCEAMHFIEQSFLDARCRPTLQEYRARDKSFVNIGVEIPGQELPKKSSLSAPTARGSPGMNHLLDGLCAVSADHPLNGLDDLVLSRFSAKDETGYGNNDNEKRSEGEKGVLGKCCR
jgi:hypothetical protein